MMKLTVPLILPGASPILGTGQGLLSTVQKLAREEVLYAMGMWAMIGLVAWKTLGRGVAVGVP
jgi:hypothetical protein